MTSEIRHVNTLILDPYIDAPKNALSQHEPPCRTGLYFRPNATNRRGTRRGCTSKRGHLARLSRAVQFFWPKGYAYTKTCEPHSTSIAGGTDKLAGSDSVAADVNLVLVVDGADCRLTEETSDAIINSGPSLDTLSGSKPQSFSNEPGVGMLEEPHTLVRPPPNVVPLDLLDESAKSIASAQPPAVTGFSLLPDMRGGGASQRLEQRLRLGAARAPPGTATDLIGHSNVQLTFLRHLPIILRVCYAGLHNAHYSGRLVDILRIGRRRASLRLPSTARRIRTITPTILPICYGPSPRYLPFEMAGGFANAIAPTARGIRITQSPEGCDQMHQALPPISPATCCYTIRSRLGQLRSVLAPGESCFHTLAWDSNTSTGVSGFGRALHSGDSPNGAYPSSSGWNERSMGPNSEWIERTDLAMQERDANFRDANDVFDGRPAVSASTSSCHHVNTPTPQQRGSAPAPPVPLTAFDPSQLPHIGPYGHEILSGDIYDRPWLIPTPTGSMCGRRSSYHPEPVPSNSQRQYGGAEHRQLSGLSYNAFHGPDSLNQPTDMLYPIGRAAAQTEHQAPALGPAVDPPFPGQTPAAGRTSGAHQHPCDPIPSSSLSACAANVALTDTTQAIPELIASSESTQSLVVSPNTCPVCNRVFRRPYLLRDHMASSHGQQGQAKRHPCQYPGCTSAYTSHSNLKRHRSQKHPRTDNSHTPLNPMNDAHGVLLVELERLGTMGSQNLAQYATEPPLPSVEESYYQRTWEEITVQQPLAGPSLNATNIDLQFVDDAVANRELGGVKFASARSRTKRRRG